MIGDLEEIDVSRKSSRFLFFFCHDYEIGDNWGFNFSFKCGIFFHSLLVVSSTIFDIISLSRLIPKKRRWFIFWCIIRFVSDFIALIGILLAIISIFQMNVKKATLAYYSLFLSLVVNTAFFVYCIVSLFDKTFWSFTGTSLIIWMLNELILFYFLWLLFGSMAFIGRKQREAMASNPV